MIVSDNSGFASRSSWGNSNMSASMSANIPTTPAGPSWNNMHTPGSFGSHTGSSPALSIALDNRAPIASGSSTTVEDLAAFANFDGGDFFDGDINTLNFDFDPSAYQG
jgi:hypothetical protein